MTYLPKNSILSAFSIAGLLFFTACGDNSADDAPTVSDSTATTYENEVVESEMVFSNSYMITNRANPSLDTNTSYTNDTTAIVPLPAGELSFYMADAPYDTTPGDYDSVGWTSFSQALINDLNKTGSNGVKNITIFIHGLDTEWPQSFYDLGMYGQGLQANGYEGLVIGFSWPSYADRPTFSIHLEDQLAYYATSYIQTASSGSIRDNINGSVESFYNLLDTVMGLKSQFDSLQINLAAHSEGNFMTMMGLNYASAQPNPFDGQKLDQVLLLAADINNGALQSPTMPRAATGNKGDGGSIVDLSRWVTVYYSIWDDVLTASREFQDIGEVHNPNYTSRLGEAGPTSFTGIQTNVSAINSMWVNEQGRLDSLKADGLVPNVPIMTHTSYIYVAELLADQANTLNLNAASGDISNQRLTDDHAQQYCLQCDTLCDSDHTNCAMIHWD